MPARLGPLVESLRRRIGLRNLGSMNRSHAPKLAALVLLVGCASDDAQTPATSTPATAAPTTSAAPPPTTTTAEGDGAVQAVIEIDGGQLLGLAVDETAVWPVSFDAGTIS